jgi:hypothetical protein
VALRKPRPARAVGNLAHIEAMERQQRQQRQALTAATAQVDLGSGSSWRTWKFGNRDWQIEGWRLYDIIPEHHFLTGRIGDSIAKARLYVAELDETGEETGETEDERVRRLAAVPLGTGSQRDDNLRLAGIDLAVGGECWIVGEGAATAPEAAEGSWFVVTGSAFSKVGDEISVKRPKTRGGSKLVLQDGTDILIRCWRPHPNDTDQADSFTRSAIVPLREIELLTKREFAELDSRLTGAGLMFVPEGMDFPRGADDPEGLAGFMAYMQRVAALSMQDQSRASAMVPIMATVPDELLQYVDQIKPINFWSELSAEISPMKKDAIARIGAAAEIPADVMDRLGDMNHWSGWLVTEEGIRWIGGYLGLIADALTRGFLRPALLQLGITNPERFAFAFDTSTLAARPNRLEEALQLHDRFLLSDEEAVKAGAFTTEQMPSVQERAQQLLLKVVQSQPGLMLDPAVQAALGLPTITTDGQPAIEQAPAGEPDDTEEPPADGPPNEGNAPSGEAASIAQALDRRIELAAYRVAAPPSPEAVFNAAAKLMVYRALELAGGRLTTLQERRGRWAEVPRHELHSRVGPITPDKAAKVTEGAWNHVASVAADLGVDSDELGRVLQVYVTELLTRGMAHHDDLLFAALAMPNRGRGLVAA